MARVKDFFFDEIEDQAMRVNYPIEYDSIHKDCEQDIHVYWLQLQNVKTYAPSVVREHKAELIEHMKDLIQYLGDLG